MATQTVNISLDTELLKLVDKAAKSEFASRSDIIRQVLVERLKADGYLDQNNSSKTLQGQSLQN